MDCTVKKILIIMQAKQTSSRLPNKIFLPLFKKPLFHFLYDRLNQLSFDLVIAAPNTSSNIKLAKYLIDNKLNYFLGSEDNVFIRFLEIIKLKLPDIVVRVNSDCPFLSPENVESVVKQFIELKADYLSTTLDNSFPLGEHIEAISTEAFLRASRNNIDTTTKEHVTPIFYKSLEFKSLPYYPSEKLDYPSGLRLCIDYEKDYIFFQEIEKLISSETFTYEDLINICNSNPKLLLINSHFHKSRTV